MKQRRAPDASLFAKVYMRELERENLCRLARSDGLSPRQQLISPTTQRSIGMRHGGDDASKPRRLTERIKL
jgi:hypothetical protein